MTIKVIKPTILYNKYHPEHEEKPVVEPTTKTSEDVHGGDEITQSMKDQRFAQQQNENQTQSEQQQNQQNNDNNVQPGEQTNENTQSQINGNQQTEQQNNNTQQTNEIQQNELQNDNETNQQNNNNNAQAEQNNETQQQNQNASSQPDDKQTEQQNNTQQTDESQQNDQSQTNQQQNELQNDNNQQNETNQQNNKTQSEHQQTNENQQTEEQQNAENETEEHTLDDSVSDNHQEQEVEEEDDEGEQYDYYEDEEEQEDTIQYNTQQAFEINEEHNIERQLYLTFYRLVEYLSDEEKQPTLLPGQTLVLNVKKLMMRQYERKPINAYYYYRTRSQVVLILDNSGSMAWLMDELSTFFKAALKRKDVIIYVAPNGHIEEYYNDKTKRFEVIDHEDAIQQIIKSSLPVIYVGDFDGANTPIELSWTNRVYWICTETRYKYFSHHDWVGRCLKEDDFGNCEDFRPYYEDDFKGFFGRAFNDEEIITVLKEFAKNIQKQRFWYDKHDIKDFSEE